MIKKIMAQVLLVMLILSAWTLSAADTSYFDQKAYKKGDDNADVKLIQIALYLNGNFELDNLTTTFGPKTETAVKAFQTQYGLTADGVVGSGTIDKMSQLDLLPRLTQSSYKMEDENNEIRFIQTALISEGLLDISTPTTSFATLTEQAVKAFQQKYYLTVDGIVGEETIQKLNALGFTKGTDTAEVASENDSDGESGFTSSDLSFAGTVSLTSYEVGMDNEDCQTIQKALASLGYLNRTSFTTVYDNDTLEAVKAFQTASGLEADGVIGPVTFNKLAALGVVSYEAPVVSRGSGERYGEYLDWFKEVLPMAKAIYGEDYRGKIKIVIEDYYTGVKINALFSYGHNHMDIEPLTKEDTEKIKQLWDYNYSWTMRPVLVHYLDHIVAGSLAGMPHAASTLDRLGNNGMAGVLDLHFKNSRTHATNKIDDRHQKQIKIAAGVTK